MLGHDDVSPEIEARPATGRLDGLDEPVTSSIAGQQRETAIAGEGQFVGMAYFVITSASLAGHWDTGTGIEGVSAIGA